MNTGYYNPSVLNRLAAAPAPAPAAVWDGSFWDQAKLDAARAAQAPGEDGRRVGNDATWMAALNSLSGLTKSSEGRAASYVDPSNFEGGGQGGWTEATPAYYKDKFGRGYKVVPGAEGDQNTYIQFTDNSGGGFENAASDNGHDRVQPIYKLNADGTATPHSANTGYEASEWVNNGRDVAKLAAIAAATYFGGSALAASEMGGGAAAGAATEGGLGAVAQSSATKAALYGAEGYGSTLTGAQITAYDAAIASGASAADAAAAAESAAPSSGGGASEAAQGIGGESPGTTPEVANTGSDAHFYQPQEGGPGVQDLANMGGAGGGTTPTWTGQGGTNWTGKEVLDAAGQVIKVGQVVAPLLGAGGGGGGGGGGSNPGALNAMAAQDMGGARRYAYDGFQATPQAPRAGHTMGPSSAVNLSDPSAAMFGYGKTPIYYKAPPPDSSIGRPVDRENGMADGGSVDPLGLDPLAMNAPVDYPERGYDFEQPKPAVDPNLPKKDEGPLAWVGRLKDGDKKAMMQAQMGGMGLGLLASLLQKRRAGPGFRSVADMKAGLGGNAEMSPARLASMQAYFNAPAARFAPGVVTAGAGGLRAYAEGGEVYEPSVHGSYVQGEGSGQDDGVDARLSPGEYVWDADVVAALGDGSNEHGARRLDAAREAIRAHKRSAPPSEIPPRALSPLEYMKMGSK